MPATATGVGSLPGTDSLDAAHLVAGELPDFLHLPELPARGPGADMIGRTGALLVDIAPDLSLETVPRGWRTTAAPGREMRRARAFLDEDLDYLEEVAQEYAGELKISACGPWTFAAGVELPSGERMLRDPGAVRDLIGALCEALVLHVAQVRRRFPRASSLLLQLDEPMLPAVLAGSIDTASGLSRYPAVDAQVVSAGVEQVLTSIAGAQALGGVHCCAPAVPLDLLRAAGAQFCSVDLLIEQDEEQIGRAWESGTRLMLGAVPSVGEGQLSDTRASAPIRALADRLGLVERTESIVVTPTCGLAGASPAWVRTAYAAVRGAARVLRDDVGHVDE